MKEGILYDEEFIYDGEFIENNIPHGQGMCFYATGEALVGKSPLTTRDFQKRISARRFFGSHA
jgi:hypothetical protein